MALALYRKYRPRTFAEVIGQEHVTEPLSQALRSGRLHHAYLFSGPRGCGKTSSARILARSLNCERGPTPEPCGVCISCKSLANDGTGSIDVLEIDAASHGGVDDARELREKAFFAPANSRFKIYVIDEAHMVSSAGFNALLKLVEEPPDYVKFIFATTEPDKVLGTIRSRTHHYPFRLIPPATLRPYLQQLTEAENVAVEPAVFPLVVKAGGGSARDTLSVLDQLIAGAGDGGVTYARAVALLGVTDSALIDEMCDALAAADGAAAYSTIDRVAEAGHDPRRFAADLLERLRDLIVLQQVPDAVTKGLIDGPTDQLEAMSAQAIRLGPATLSRCADIVHNGLVEMRGTTAPRLLLELVTARMLLPGADDSTGALLQRLERVERAQTANPLPPGVRDGSALDRPRAAQAAGEASASAGGGLSAARAAAAAAIKRVPSPGGAGRSTTDSDRPAPGTPAPPTQIEARPGKPVESTPTGPGRLNPINSAPIGSAQVSSGETTPSDAGRFNPVEPSAVNPVEPSAVNPVEPSAVNPGEIKQIDPGLHKRVELAPTLVPPTVLSADGVHSAPPIIASRGEVAQGATPVKEEWREGPSRESEFDDSEFYADEPPWDDEPEPEEDGAPAVRSAAVADAGQQLSRTQPVSSSVVESVASVSVSAVPPVSAAPPVAAPARRTEPAGLLPDAPQEPGEAAVAAAIPGRLDAAGIREQWPEVVAVIGQRSKRIGALASGATVRSFDGTTVVLAFRFPAHARMVAPEAGLISDALDQTFGGRWEVRCDVASEADLATAAQTPSRDTAQRDTAQRDTAQRDTAQRDTAQRDTPQRETTQRETGRTERGGLEVGRGAQARPGDVGRGVQGNGPSGSIGADAGVPQSATRSPRGRPPATEATVSDGGDDDWPAPAKPGSLATTTQAEIVGGEEDGWPEVRAAGSGADSREPDVHLESTPASGPIQARSVTEPEPSSTEVSVVSRDFSSRGASAANEMADGGHGGEPGSAVATASPDRESGEAGQGEVNSRSPERAGSRNAGPLNGLAAARAAAAGGRTAASRQGAKSDALSGYKPDVSSGGQPDGPSVVRSDVSLAGRADVASASQEAMSSGAGLTRSERESSAAAGEFVGFDPGDEPLDEVIDEKTARESGEQQAVRLLHDAFGVEKIGES